jgi:hypothetical protein
MLAINLFQDDVVGVFGSLGRLLWHSLLRIACTLPAVIVVLGPLILLLTQLASWYEWRPLMPEQETVIELQIDRDHWQEGQHAQLSAPETVAVEAGPMRDVGQLAVFWRIRPKAVNDAVGRIDLLQWDVAGDQVAKLLSVAEGDRPLYPVSPRRAGSGWWDQILYPVEPALPSAGAVRGIELHYPPRMTPVFGWNVPWWLTFLIVSMVAALAVKPWVGVRF